MRSHRTKISIVICLSLMFVVGLSVSRIWLNKNKAAAIVLPLKLEYKFETKGIMLGEEPSPVAMVKVLNKGTEVAFGKPVTGDEQATNGFEVRVKNISNKVVTYVQLRLDLIDPQTGVIAGKLPIMGLKTRLAPGQEYTSKMISNAPSALREMIAATGLSANRARITVDSAVSADGIRWKYGNLMRRAPYDSRSWVVIGLEDEFKEAWDATISKGLDPETRSFKASASKGSYFACGIFTGEWENGFRCNDPNYPNCFAVNEVWTPYANGFAYGYAWFYACIDGGASGPGTQLCGNGANHITYTGAHACPYIP